MPFDTVSLHSALLFDACGPVLLVGGGRPDLVPVLSAAAQDVVLVVPPWREPGLVHDLEDAGIPVTVPDRDENGLPIELPPVSNLVFVDELPDCDPLLLIDRALAAVAHDGAVCIDLDGDAVHDGRFRRLVEAGVSFDDDVPWAPWAAPGRIALHGRRRAPGREVVPAASELSPLTYVLVAVGDEEPSDVIADVLLRQTHPAELLLILDPHDLVDDDLWGMQAHGLTQPAILRPEGDLRGAWLAEALEHVETEFFAVLDGTAALAPRHAFVTTAVLAASEDAVGALTSGITTTEGEDLEPFDADDHDENPCLDLWGPTPFPNAAVCLRAESARAVGGFDAELDGAAEHDLWLRLAERGRFVRAPWPLFLDLEPDDDHDEQLATVLASAHERDALGRLAACFAGHAEAERRPTALLHRALALSAVGLAERAARDLEAARTGADAAAFALTAARVHHRNGAGSAARAALEAAPAAMKSVLADWRAAALMNERDPEGALRELDGAAVETVEGLVLRLFALADVTDADPSIALVLGNLVQELTDLGEDVIDGDVVTF